MNVSRIFVLRPVMTTLVMASFVIFGAFAYFALPVNDLPAIDFPTISVSATLPGASADTMASAVATPLEKQFTAIAGLDNMNSTSQLGQTSITLQFSLDRNIDGAAEDVQAAIIAARPLLPASMPTLPTFRKVNPGDSPILFIALSSPILPLYTVDEYAENMLAPRISMTTGVAQVQVYGSQIYSPHVQVDPRKLADYGLGLDDVANAMNANNVNLPTGTLYGPDKAYNVMANGQLFNAAAWKPIVVAYRNGFPIRLADIGNVIDSVQTDKVASWFNNTRAVVLAVQRQPNTNTIEIVGSVKKLLPQFEAVLPKAVHLDILYDRSKGIKRSVDDVKRTLLITIFLVVMVIFLFLGNVSTTAISSLALPVSIIGTFAAMKAFGFSLNNISLMGLSLCVGFVVDDAIVVMENIVRHMEMGESRLEASLRGSQEICFTIISMTLSLVAVFIPILLMGGLIGRLFFEFSVTITVAIMISGFVSISLTPMLCSRFLSADQHQQKKGLHAISEKVFDFLVSIYERTLQVALKHRVDVLIVFFLMVIATGWLLVTMPKGFMPTVDIGQLSGTTLCQEGISFESMVKHQKELADIIAKDPNVWGFMSSVGAGGPTGAGNQGRFFITLIPRNKRKLDADGVINELRKKTSKIPGIRLYLQAPQVIRIGGQSTKALYQFTLSGSDTKELYAEATKFEQQCHDLPGLVDVNTDLQMKNLQLDVNVDRNKCAQMGISMEQVQNALQSAYASRQVSVIYTATNQYWVILEVAPEFYRDPSQLSFLRISTGNGQYIPLSSVATLTRSAGPLLENHLGQFPSVTISFNLKPGVHLSDAVDEIKDLAAKSLSPDITYSFQGSAQTFEESTRNLGWLLLISVLVIYIVLGILYESYIHPLTILSGLPAAGLGALLCLLLFQKDLDIYGFLGLILLIGIVKKNAIMMIDYAVDYQRQVMATAEQAIYKACIVRFRPIMMTTIAALLGSLPIAIGTGEGSEARQPLGLAIVGGLLVSQLVTLYITPVFYIYFDRLKDWATSHRKATPVEGGAT